MDIPSGGCRSVCVCVHAFSKKHTVNLIIERTCRKSTVGGAHLATIPHDLRTDWQMKIIQTHLISALLAVKWAT